MRFNATVYISLVVFLASASVSGSPISVSFHRLQITFILFSRFPLQSENTQEVDATITHNTGAPGQEHIWTLMRQVFEEKHGWTRTQANHLNLHMVHDDSVSIRQDGKTFFAEGMLGVTRKCKGVVGPEGGQLAYTDTHEVYYSSPGNVCALAVYTLVILFDFICCRHCKRSQAGDRERRKLTLPGPSNSTTYLERSQHSPPCYCPCDSLVLLFRVRQYDSVTSFLVHPGATLTTCL
ncbi:hypothetical protein F5879DRAFT_460384 [Lentinula edodes]|nr:hypothetical protein F5879DRAFT_460384 [Lentinula edodes]